MIFGRALTLATEGFSQVVDLHFRSGPDRGGIGSAGRPGPRLRRRVDGRGAVLGTWQQIVLLDHDNNPRRRKVFVQVLGG